MSEQDFDRLKTKMFNKESLELTEKEKLEALKQAFQEVIWMAIRYADGRHTYAPSTVRDAIKQFQSVFPDWKPKRDITIKKPDDMIGGLSFQSDYLYDLVGGE